MRCNWRRWLWGLIPLMVVSWVAVQFERGPIQQDLTERAKKALIDSGSAWASVALHGRDADLRGGAILDSQPVEAEAALRKVWGVRDIDNNAVLAPKVEPFVWAARRRGNRIRLSGYVPNRATRRTIIGMANAVLPGFEVVDRMNVARGNPSADTWLAGLSFALKQLASLKQGDVRLEDLALTITGEAEDTAGYRAVSTAIKSGLPNGIKLTSARIMAPVASPYVWSVQFAGGQLMLSGSVAGESARTELLTAAKAAPPSTNVIDRMEPAEGAPQGWTNVAAAVVKGLVRLQSGNAEMKDGALVISGIAADEAEAQAVRGTLRASVPPPYKLTDQIRVREAAATPPEPAPQAAPELMPKQSEAEPPQPALQPKQTEPAPPAPAEPKQKQAEPAPQPAEPTPKTAAAPPAPAVPAPQALVDVCQESLSKVSSTGQILFDSDSATLDGASFETLNRLAAATKVCPGVRIAIEGHADIEGTAEYNQRLSVRRAQAVAAYLAKAGADAQQLEPVGFGSSRPAAPNDTAENKAKNRRIEIIVRRQ